MSDPTYGYSQRPAAGGMPSPVGVKDEAAAVGQTAVQRAGTVADTAGQQAKHVATETRRQARDLMHEGQGQLREQARDAQRKAAHSLHTLADQFQEMSAQADDSGVAAEMVQQASERAHGVASWLESREPGDLINELRAFARRRPGMFLGGAAIAGMLAGRLTRGVVAAGSEQTRPAVGTSASMPPAYPARTPDPVGALPRQADAQGTYPAVPQSDVRPEWS